MRANLPATLADRLCKLCGMLGSDHDGEGAAAGPKADALLREHGLCWRDVIRVDESGPRPPRVWLGPRHLDRGAAIQCLVWADPLTEWEIGFLRSISDRRRLTNKQTDVLRRIVGKCRIYAEFEGAA